MKDEVCPYCKGPLFELTHKVLESKHVVEGWVCVEGHLLLGLKAEGTDFESYVFDSGDGLQGSGAWIEVQRSGAAKCLCKHTTDFGHINNLQDGARFVQSLDFSRLIQVAGRLTAVVEQCTYRIKSLGVMESWKPQEVLCMERLLRESRAGGASLNDAICNGEGDVQVETLRMFERNARWSKLSRKGVCRSSLWRPPMSEAIERYLRGDNVSATKILRLQKKHPEPFKRYPDYNDRN